MRSNKAAQGFIALMSAIIISTALLVAIISGSTTLWYAEDNERDAEFKVKSAALADACGNVALLQLSENPNWPGNTTASAGEDSCSIGSVTLHSTQATFTASGTYQNAFTNLRITFDTEARAVLFWQEVPNVD